MTRTDFDQQLTAIQQHPLYTGDVFETANIIEKAYNDTSFNYVLSVGLSEDWIKEFPQ